MVPDPPAPDEPGSGAPEPGFRIRSAALKYFASGNPSDRPAALPEISRIAILASIALLAGIVAVLLLG